MAAEIEPGLVGELKGAAVWAAGVLVASYTALVRWNLKREIARTDEHAKRLEHLERSAVSRETLDQALADLRTDIKGVHQRLDKLFMHLAGGKDGH